MQTKRLVTDINTKQCHTKINKINKTYNTCWELNRNTINANGIAWTKHNCGVINPWKLPSVPCVRLCVFQVSSVHLNIQQAARTIALELHCKSNVFKCKLHYVYSSKAKQCFYSYYDAMRWCENIMPWFTLCFGLAWVVFIFHAVTDTFNS